MLRKKSRFPLSICPENKEWFRHLTWWGHLHNSWKLSFTFQPLSVAICFNYILKVGLSKYHPFLHQSSPFPLALLSLLCVYCLAPPGIWSSCNLHLVLSPSPPGGSKAERPLRYLSQTTLGQVGCCRLQPANIFANLSLAKLCANLST